MVKLSKTAWKNDYFNKLIQLLEEYPKCLIVCADHVGSKQMQQIRKSLRGTAVVLMGKNTMIRKAIKGHLDKASHLEKLLDHVRYNVGFVFTKDDLCEVKTKLVENKVKAPAKAGGVAPCQVTIFSQNTGLGPEKTSFFQALSIPTKISKGTIEITNDVHILKEGDKVGASEATLLNMLNISPFSYGLVVQKVYDSGSVYDAKVLDISAEYVRNQFLEGALKITSICLAINYPTWSSVRHSIINGFKNLVAVAVLTDINFTEALKFKDYVKDPSRFISAKPEEEIVVQEVTTEPKTNVESEESDEDFGFGLFD